MRHMGERLGAVAVGLALALLVLWGVAVSAGHVPGELEYKAVCSLFTCDADGRLAPASPPSEPLPP